MIQDLDATLAGFLIGAAPRDSLLSGATVNFSPPNETWQAALEPGLTLNCYLYDIRENMEVRRPDPIVYRATTADGPRVSRRIAPARIDCRFCITAWSVLSDSATGSVADEHQLLGDVLRLLLRNRVIPSSYLVGSLRPASSDRDEGKLPPYPMVVAEPDALRSQPDYWVAFNQQPRPSLTYLVTLTMPLDDEVPHTHRVESEDHIMLEQFVTDQPIKAL